jgi:hypothetical protein
MHIPIEIECPYCKAVNKIPVKDQWAVQEIVNCDIEGGKGGCGCNYVVKIKPIIKIDLEIDELKWEREYYNKEVECEKH